MNRDEEFELFNVSRFKKKSGTGSKGSADQNEEKQDEKMRGGDIYRRGEGSWGTYKG